MHTLISSPPNWIADTRSRRAAELLAVIWIVSVVDVTLTIWAHHFTSFQEMNPIAEVMLGNGIATLLLYKMTVNTIGTVIFWRLRYHAKAEAGLWLVAILYVMLAFRWSSYTMAASTETDDRFYVAPVGVVEP